MSPELIRSALTPERSFFCGQDRATGARAEAGDTRLGVRIIVHTDHRQELQKISASGNKPTPKCVRLLGVFTFRAAALRVNDSAV